MEFYSRDHGVVKDKRGIHLGDVFIDSGPGSHLVLFEVQ